MQRLGDRKEDTKKVTRQLEDLNTLKDQIQQKEKEWETTEQQLRIVFYTTWKSDATYPQPTIRTNLLPKNTQT